MPLMCVAIQSSSVYSGTNAACIFSVSVVMVVVVVIVVAVFSESKFLSVSC